MPFTKGNKITASILAIIIGWLLNAFAWITTSGNPISTISLLFGIILFLGGIVLLVVALIKK